ncbi:MAG: helix-turn-helix transcriptional regulator [bacterium]|nr:helix-turn-helix transcriptional regulator [bacterium]
MKKIAKKYNSISLDAVIKEKLKSERFRKTFSEEMSRLQLAHEIKTLRQERKMTQKEVAAKADMPQSVIARIESGTHSFSIATLHKIANVFDKQVGLVG